MTETAGKFRVGAKSISIGVDSPNELDDRDSKSSNNSKELRLNLGKQISSTHRPTEKLM